MINCFAVGLGGFFGATLRYLVGLIDLHDSSGFPYKTLAINILGSFVIGLIGAYASKAHNADPRMILFLKTGLCGGFTTFSTFALESAGLIQNGRTGSAALYMVLSVVLSVIAVFAAQYAVR